MDKLFIQADELLSDSFKLAWKVYESGTAQIILLVFGEVEPQSV